MNVYKVVLSKLLISDFMSRVYYRVVLLKKYDIIIRLWNVGNITPITKVTQNNTGIYTQKSSQQTFKIRNNSLYVEFEKAFQNHNNEIVDQKIGQDKPQSMMVNC